MASSLNMSAFAPHGAPKALPSFLHVYHGRLDVLTINPV
jgi:hypothetical protein